MLVIVRMNMMMLICMRMLMSVPTEEMMMRVAFAAELSEQIKRAQPDQHRARDPGKPHPDSIGQRDSKPGDEQAKRGGEDNVAAASEGGDAQSLGVVPTLRARGEDEWQPMGRNGRVKKSHAETRNRDSGEDRVVHLVLLLVIVIAIEHEHD